MIESIYKIYPPKLEAYTIESKFIPRKIHSNEHLKLFHKYWLELYNGLIKVEDIFEIDKITYYVIRYDSRLYSCVSHPIAVDSCYELLHNKEGIENNNIINDTISYSGAEIKYWFVVNKIDFDKDEYNGFWSFLNPASNNLLIDNKYYFVSYDTKRKQKCQMVLDKSKL